MTRRGTLLAGWSLALVVAALFARLGAWQLDRMHWKQAQLDAARSVLQARAPHPLALAADARRQRGYDWAAGHGRYAALPAVLLDNQEHAGRIGVRAYRVFLPHGGVPLLVELGWLPVPGDRRMPSVPPPAGAQAVRGLLAPPPSAGLARPLAQVQPDGSLLLVSFDLPLLRRTLRLPTLAPRVLKLDPALPPSYPRSLDILPNTLPPGRHLGYAVQWFALAATVLVIALVLSLRKPKGGAP